MSYFQEKILFGVFSFTSGSIMWLGAVMTTGEARWLYITAAASIMTSGFLSLVFRRPSETIRIVIGRAGLATLGGVFGTRLVVHQWEMGKLAEDGINLAGMAAGVCIVVFLLGIKFLNAIARRSDLIISRLEDAFLPDQKAKKPKEDE